VGVGRLSATATLDGCSIPFCGRPELRFSLMPLVDSVHPTAAQLPPLRLDAFTSIEMTMTHLVKQLGLR